MMRRWFLLALLVGLGCGHVSPPAVAPTTDLVKTSKPKQSAPPNIVILFADDLGYGDLGSYGHPSIRTPHLDALARAGQRWTDFYAAAPVCSPSRGALLTGKYPVRSGLYGKRINVMFPGDPGGFPESQRSLAELLGEHGYATGIIGKWHLGDAPAHRPTRHGFDYWYGLPYSNDMDWVGHPSFEELLGLTLGGHSQKLQAELDARSAKYLAPKIEYWNVPLMRSRRDAGAYQDEVLERPTDQRTLTARSTREAIGFIETNRDRPFLLYVPYSMPHTPIFRSPEFVDSSLAGRYGDVVEELDYSVGQIVARLQALDLAERTLVVFTSDNGPWLTMEHHGGSAGLLKQGKGTTFEGGMRVPGIFYWPGTIDPAVISGIGSAMDLFATVLSLAGVPLPQDIDSIDLSPALLRAEPSPRRNLAYYRSGELHAFRQGKHKLHLITQGAYQQPPERAVHNPGLLYDLRSDPGERFDLSSRAPEVITQIQAAIAAHRDALRVQPPIFDARLAQLEAR